MRETDFFNCVCRIAWCFSGNCIQNNSPVIKGKVTDLNGSPLPGASITIDKTSLGAHADSDGMYTLSVPKDGIYLFRFCFIGYESQICELNLIGA